MLAYSDFTFYNADIEILNELKPIFEAHNFRSVFIWINYKPVILQTWMAQWQILLNHYALGVHRFEIE